MQIAYGSLKETKYLLHFCSDEGYLNKKDYNDALTLAEEIGKILWVLMNKVKEKANI